MEEQFRLIKNQGRINVVSIPEEAAIWIDGKNTLKRTDCLLDLPTGEHELVLMLPGYKDVKKRVLVEPEGFTEIEFKLEKGSNAPLPEPAFTDPITCMEFVYVSGGKFMMGDVFGDGREEEKPVHEVELKGFYIGKYAVTQGQWKKVMGELKTREYHFLFDEEEINEYQLTPVIDVSWDDAQQFIKKLNVMNKGKYQFRLPTEAEWEYAARSGGKKEKYAGGDDAYEVAWYALFDEVSPKPVGTKAPNGFGLYDMSGNVFEWCQDWYGNYPSRAVIDPKGPSSGSYRVTRGGSWYKDHFKDLCRTTNRGAFDPDSRHDVLGFRLAATL